MFLILKLSSGRSKRECCYHSLARKVQSPCVGGPVEALPRDGEGQQQLLVLAHSVWVPEHFQFQGWAH